MALGERVTHIRLTRTGELLLELGKNGTDTQNLQKAVASSLNEAATVTSPTHKEQVMILDIDEATEVAEITDVISSLIGPGCVAPDAIKLRVSYRGTQSATLLLPAEAATGREAQDRLGQLSGPALCSSMLQMLRNRALGKEL